MRVFFLLLFCSLFGTSLLAQQMLIIENTKTLKRHRYIKGMEVSFKYDTAEVVEVSGDITRVFKDTVVVNGQKFAIAKIFSWNKKSSERRMGNFARTGFRTGGRLFFAISLFNGLTNNDSPVIPKAAIYALGIGEVLGLFFAHVPRSHFDLLKDKWQLKMVDFSLPED